MRIYGLWWVWMGKISVSFRGWLHRTKTLFLPGLQMLQDEHHLLVLYLAFNCFIMYSIIYLRLGLNCLCLKIYPVLMTKVCIVKNGVWWNFTFWWSISYLHFIKHIISPWVLHHYLFAPWVFNFNLLIFWFVYVLNLDSPSNFH